MSDILPPQLNGAQQSSLYVKIRTIVTVISGVWLILALTGFGFFSGGTTSLALSLILMYATGAALIVVIAAVYRAVKKTALRRSETAPEDTAALAFIDTTRSAANELLAALRPAPPTGRAYDPSGRAVGPAVSMIDAVAAARAASKAAVASLTSGQAAADAGRTDRPAAKGQAPAGRVPAARHASSMPPARKFAAKAASRPAAAKKPAPASADTASASKPAAGKTSGRTSGRGAGKTPGKSAGNSAKKKTVPPVSGPTASPVCASPAKGGRRPALVLAVSNPVPEAVRKMHGALTRQKAS